jgi:hypothetical protein
VLGDRANAGFAGIDERSVALILVIGAGRLFLAVVVFVYPVILLALMCTHVFSLS